jgi:hypothetical protein
MPYFTVQYTVNLYIHYLYFFHEKFLTPSHQNFHSFSQEIQYIFTILIFLIKGVIISKLINFVSYLIQYFEQPFPQAKIFLTVISISDSHYSPILLETCISLPSCNPNYDLKWIIKLFEDVQRVSKANVQFGAAVGALK